MTWLYSFALAMHPPPPKKKKKKKSFTNPTPYTVDPDAACLRNIFKLLDKDETGSVSLEEPPGRNI